MLHHNYYTYITTNSQKTILYVGVTNDLDRRMLEHFENRGNSQTFAGKYFCYNLIYFERHDHISIAIAREKEIKGWRREKKDALIRSFNPEWKFLNAEIKN
jgi:putative endonuclease